MPSSHRPGAIVLRWRAAAPASAPNPRDEDTDGSGDGLQLTPMWELTVTIGEAQFVVADDPGPWVYGAMVTRGGRPVTQLRIERDESSGEPVTWIEIVQPGPFRIAEAEIVAQALQSIASEARLAQADLRVLPTHE